jgi:hypothetical protein
MPGAARLDAKPTSTSRREVRIGCSPWYGLVHTAALTEG